MAGGTSTEPALGNAASRSRPARTSRWSSRSSAGAVEPLAQAAAWRASTSPASVGRTPRGQRSSAASRPRARARRSPARRPTACSRARPPPPSSSPRARPRRGSGAGAGRAASRAYGWAAFVSLVLRGARLARLLPMTTLHTLRVFLGPDGEGGNPLGVVLDGAARPAPRDRQAVAADLGFSETVFVDDAHDGASCGSTRRRSSSRSPAIRSSAPPGCSPPAPRRHAAPAGGRRARRGATASSRGSARGRSGRRSTTSPGSRRRPTSTPSRSPAATRWSRVWAWEDEAAGRVRARVFPNGIGIDEDEATGAAALQFGALHRPRRGHPPGRGLRAARAPGRRRDRRGGRAGGARLRAELRTVGRGLTSSPAERPARIDTAVILCGGRGTRLQGRASPSRSSRSAGCRSSGTSPRSSPPRASRGSCSSRATARSWSRRSRRRAMARRA